MSIQTVADYRGFVTELKGRLTAIWEDVPEREKSKRALKIASDLQLSQTTIQNYFAGLISSPETALTILEKYNELYVEAV